MESEMVSLLLLLLQAAIVSVSTVAQIECCSFSFFTQGLSAQDLIDFSPVYRCLHIYTVLVWV